MRRHFDFIYIYSGCRGGINFFFFFFWRGWGGVRGEVAVMFACDCISLRVNLPLFNLETKQPLRIYVAR